MNELSARGGWAESPRLFVAFIAASLAAILIAGCGGGDDSGGSGSPASGGPGVLSISASPQLAPYPTTATALTTAYSNASDLAYSTGARGQVLTYTWSVLEPTAGQYDAAKIAELLAAIDHGRTLGLTQFVGLQVVNSSVNAVPGDLASLAFDDARVQSRFRALLDKIVGARPGSIAYLSIGNEFDLYLAAHPGDAASYKRFFASTAQYARSLDAKLKVGVTVRADGALGAQASLLQDMNAAGSDVVMLTYYPLQTDSAGLVTVRAPSVVAGDMSGLLAFAGSKPMVFQEVGYPASTTNQSSQALQADFIRALFAGWQSAGGRIPFLNLFTLHDFTSQTCDGFIEYYGVVATPSFKSYLCSLGLRQVDGTPREAWSALMDETALVHLR